MKLYHCSNCRTMWADIYLLPDNKCKICGTVCSEIVEPEAEPEPLFLKREQTLEEFLNDPKVAQSTLDARRHCNEQGHQPCANDEQGMNGEITGCWCGWIQLSRPFHPKTDWIWSDLE